MDLALTNNQEIATLSGFLREILSSHYSFIVWIVILEPE